MQRFKALDVFRGMTICLMIVVNTPGSWNYVYAPFLHADWHGFTPTDLVFPSFLFAVGNAFAFVKSRWADKQLSDVFGKILKRTFLIFIIGYLLTWFPFVRWDSAGEMSFKSFGDVRVLGVLQRIALCYFFAALLIFFFNKRQVINVAGILLLGYWALMYGFGDYSLENNFARTFDSMIFSDGLLYHGEGIAFDPEGLLSTLPAIVNVIGGYLAGVYIIQGKTLTYEKVSKIMIWGCVLMGAAYIWDLGFPINKKIWTSSYVLLTVGMDLVILGILIYLIDFRVPKFEFRFFEIFGKNPLFIYVLSIFFVKLMFLFEINGQNLYSYFYENVFRNVGDKLGSFLFAFVFMMICWSFGKWLDKKKIYIKV